MVCVLFQRQKKKKINWGVGDTMISKWLTWVVFAVAEGASGGTVLGLCLLRGEIHSARGKRDAGPTRSFNCHIPVRCVQELTMQSQAPKRVA